MSHLYRSCHIFTIGSSDRCVNTLQHTTTHCNTLQHTRSSDRCLRHPVRFLCVLSFVIIFCKVTPPPYLLLYTPEAYRVTPPPYLLLYTQEAYRVTPPPCSLLVCKNRIHKILSHRNTLAKTHRMPYLYRSFSAKEPYN